MNTVTGTAQSIPGLRAIRKTLPGIFVLMVSMTPVVAAQGPAVSAAAGQTDAVEPPMRWVFKWRDHPSLSFGDIIRIDFRARFQADVRSSDVSLDDDDLSAVDLARRRIGVAGELARVVDFQIEGELGSDNTWRDVFINYRPSDRLQVQGGKFKLPFSLDENTSATNLDFVYRSRAASQLAPGRDRGLMAHGRVQQLRYEVGVFAHDGDNARGNNATHVSGDATLGGRVTVQPFRSSKSPAEDLQAGVAYTTSDVPVGVSDIRGRMALGQPFFPSGLWVSGARRRVGFETRWRPGPFSIKSEYIYLSEERLGQGVQDNDLPSVVSRAWYVSGTWIATGERKSRGPDEPKRPLFGGGYGAIELAARVESLRFEGVGDDVPSTSPRAETLAPSRDRAITVGVNWFPNRWVKVQANAIRESLVDPGRPALGSASTFWSRVIRFQFTL